MGIIIFTFPHLRMESSKKSRSLTGSSYFSNSFGKKPNIPAVHSRVDSLGDKMKRRNPDGGEEEDASCILRES